MSRPTHTGNGSTGTRKSAVVVTENEAGLVTIAGVLDESFAGFGPIGQVRTLVLDVSGITRMTSFGVAQWLKCIGALPKTIADLYLLGCPTFFVDQLNMILNFGGAAKVLTVFAPYTCTSCGAESAQLVDMLAERADLVRNGPPNRSCGRCGESLAFDESPAAYFSFAIKYGATSIQAAAAQLLAKYGLYTSVETATEKPPRVIKLVHGSVTYFHIAGTIGAMFRARPFLVGAEGEIVIDLAEVDRFDLAADNEWRRLIKRLTAQVSTVTLVDVNESFFATAKDTISLARNVAVATVLVPYTCVDCGYTQHESKTLNSPSELEDHVCSRCGGMTRTKISAAMLGPLQRVTTRVPEASARVIEHRRELVSRALANATSDGDTPTIYTDDTILGKYKIVRPLSAGGMAEVFLAKQVGIGGFEKLVALKRIQHKLLESRHQAVELFLNEAKIAGRLTHPNIVQVLDIGQADGALYLAMEYVRGRDLREILKKLQRDHTTMPLAEACYVVREIAQALDHAYWSTDMAGKQMSVVHRDVTPHNVILGYDGTVKLLDFGVAMSAVTEHAESILVGKWMYMSPETTMNEQIDHRSDLFSLGVIFYLLCSGVMPFSGREPHEIVKNIRAGANKPLAEIAPQIPAPLARLVTKLLSSSPDLRPQRGLELVIELADMMRREGLESSPQRLAEFVAAVLPEHAEDVDTSLNELVRVYADEPSRATTRDSHRASGDPANDKSPVSITPSAATSLRTVDVSETFRKTELLSEQSMRSEADVSHKADVSHEDNRNHRSEMVIAIVTAVVLVALAIISAAFFVT